MLEQLIVEPSFSLSTVRSIQVNWLPFSPFVTYTITDAWWLLCVLLHVNFLFPRPYWTILMSSYDKFMLSLLFATVFNHTALQPWWFFYTHMHECALPCYSLGPRMLRQTAHVYGYTCVYASFYDHQFMEKCYAQRL